VFFVGFPPVFVHKPDILKNCRAQQKKCRKKYEVNVLMFGFHSVLVVLFEFCFMDSRDNDNSLGYFLLHF